MYCISPNMVSFALAFSISLQLFIWLTCFIFSIFYYTLSNHNGVNKIWIKTVLKVCKFKLTVLTIIIFNESIIVIDFANVSNHLIV